MLANLIAPWLARRGIHYGWVMVGLTFFASLCSSAAISLPGVILLPIIEEFGWARGDVSSAIGLMLIMFAVVAPFAGALCLKYGVRRVVITSAALATTSLILATQTRETWHLLISFGLLLGTAAGMVALALSATVVSRWFVERRGLAMGVLTGAFAAGQLTFLPLAAWLGTEYGWRVAVAPAIIGAAVSVTVYTLFARDWPAEVGLAPYGSDEMVEPTDGNSATVVALSFQVLREAVGHRAFWVLGFTFFICGFSSTGIINQHFIPMSADRGVSAVVAASFLALMGVFNFAGTICSGWLSDRFDNRVLLACYYSLRGLSLVILPFTDFSPLALTVFAILFGLDYIATVPPTARLSVHYFGAVKGPIVFGWAFAAHQAGGALSAYAGGVTRDMWASYTPIMLAIGLTCMATALVVFVLKDHRAGPQAQPA